MRGSQVCIDITDSSRKHRVATVSQPLSDLVHQRSEALTLAMTRTDAPRAPAGRLAGLPKPLVYVKLRFQYSKVLPIKHRLFEIRDYQRKLERDVTNRVGKG